MSTEPNKGRKWLLIASLTLNLLVVGAVIGALIKGGPDNRQSRFDLTAGPILRAMPADERDALAAALRENGVFKPGDRMAIRADMDALVEVMKAEDFDADAFRETVSRQRVRLQAGQDVVVETIVTQIEGMSPEVRAEFAQRLEEQLRRRADRDR